MQWKEITVYTTTQASEIVADIFWDLSASGVCILDKNDLIELINSTKNWDYVDDELINQSENVLVKGFVPTENFEKSIFELNERLNFLRESNCGISVGSLEINSKIIDDCDWINIWKKHYKPIHFRNVVVCPKWIDYEKGENEVVVMIDPGMAFGTGEHETTGMCIELVQDFDVKDKVVFDIGCGSGILGITAKKLGAKSVQMADIDQIAETASHYNARLNNVEDEVEIYCCNLLDMSVGKADLIFANITADILIQLSKSIVPFLNDNGKVILSGIIHSRLDDVAGAFKECGLKEIKRIRNGEWNAVSFEKV